MKLNWLTKFCLIAACLLLGGVFIVQAAGFVSYEDDNKIIIWDPVKMTGKGLKMSAAGVNDLEDVPDGVIKIDDKDLYVRGFMGFDCPNYPQEINCTTTIGDVGGDTFLRIETLSGDDLLLKSAAGISLNQDVTDALEIRANIFLTDDKNLVVTDFASEDRENSSRAVYVNTLNTQEIIGLGTLNIPGIKFFGEGVLEPRRRINISL
jgi:hypothetical protein